MVMSEHEALDRDPVLKALSVFRGVTTADGNVGGTTLVCAALIGSNDFISNDKGVLLLTGNSRFQHKGATAFNPVNGEITVSPAFGSQVLAGTYFYLLNSSTAAILALLNAIKTQTDKLAGQAPVTGATAANWQAAEQTITTIGAAGVRYKVNSAMVSIANLIGNVSIRMYISINGVQRQIFPPKPTTFNVPGSDAPGIAVINGPFEIANVLTIKALSDNAADNGATIDFEYDLEAM